MTTSRIIAWCVWLIASIFYAYQYILRVMPSIMLSDIMQQFQIDATIFGQFSGVYYLGYALIHLPIGMMLDHYGPRKVMTGCILLTVIGLLPLLFADHWIYPVIGRALIGIGSSAAILGTFKIIRMTFQEKHFTRMLSLSVTIGLIGAIYGGAPVSYMRDMLGYKAVIQLFIAMGLALAVLTYAIVPKLHVRGASTVMSDIRLVFSNRKVIFLCCFAGLMVGPLEGFADVWGAAFFNHVYRFDSNVSSYLPSMIFIGMCFGAPLLSMMAEKTGRYLGVITGAGFVMLFTFLALLTTWLTIPVITISFMVVGLCCAYQILAIYKASTYVPERVAGLTTAVANMIIMSFGYGFHSVMGWLIQSYGGPESSAALEIGVSVIPMTLAMGILGFILLGYADRTSRTCTS